MYDDDPDELAAHLRDAGEVAETVNPFCAVETCMAFAAGECTCGQRLCSYHLAQHLRERSGGDGA